MSVISKMTTDHEKIKKWAEKRGGKPVKIKGNDGHNLGILRIIFSGFAYDNDFEHIGWDEFFEIFDDRKLAFLYQEKTRDGDKSRFNKIISRE